jgi:hypothetical protein
MIPGGGRGGIAVIAGIADIARDRKGKGKNLPRINTDERGSGIGNRKNRTSPRMNTDDTDQENGLGMVWDEIA